MYYGNRGSAEMCRRCRVYFPNVAARVSAVKRQGNCFSLRDWKIPLAGFVGIFCRDDPINLANKAKIANTSVE
jgi:hypothetical protein